MSEGEPEVVVESEALAPPAEVAATEQTETTEAATEKTAEAETTETTEEADDKPRRESQNKRLKRKNQYLQSEVLRLREEISKPAAEPAKTPREEDYNGNWGEWLSDKSSTAAANKVEQILSERERAGKEQRLRELQAELHSEFEERVDAFKEKAPDYEETVGKWSAKLGNQFSSTLYELVADSDVGPAIAYYLAKNPAISDRIDGLPKSQATREIIKIENLLSTPSTKATTAAKPLTTVKGGSSGNFDPKTASMDEYVAKRNAGWKG